MSEIKRLKVSFIDKDTMTRVEDINHVILYVNPRDNSLICTWFKIGEDGREVEIKVEDYFEDAG